MIELNPFDKDASFHHIGIVVKSIKGMRAVINPTQKVRVAFILLNGVRLELLEPLGKSSPVNRSMEKGTKLLHICYRVNNIEEAIKKCRKYGFHCIRRPASVAAFNGRIAWVYSNRYGLFELLEEL